MTHVTVTPFEISVTDRFDQVLKADVYLPEGDGPFPTLFISHPYQKELRNLPAHWVFPFSEYGPMQLYLDEGYAIVVLDLPGAGYSEGTWNPWSRAEGESTYDVIEHVAAQDWSTGKVGMIGQSYLAMSQWSTARTRPPSLVTIVPYDGACDHYRDWMYQGGIPQQGFLGSWILGSVVLQHQGCGHDVLGGGRLDVIGKFLSHPLDDDWWRAHSPYWELDQVDIPVFSIGVWGKLALHLRGNVNGFEKVQGPKHLLITEPDSFQGAQALFDDPDFHRSELLPWYEHHLKGVANGVMERAPVRYWRKNGGGYREASTWPPEGVTAEALYLSGDTSDLTQSLNDGVLASEPPATGPEATSWSYPDPQWRAGVTTFVNGRPDHVARVNTFTTAPFKDAREYTGHGAFVAHVSSDQEDAELHVKLMLLPAGGGLPIQVTRGWLRAGHRKEDPALTSDLRPFHTHDAVDPIAPGEIYKMRVELFPMSVQVNPGDRLRLEITNWDSTLLDQPMIHWYGKKVGTDTYHHSPAHPSHLLLPKVGG